MFLASKASNGSMDDQATPARFETDTAGSNGVVVPDAVPENSTWLDFASSLVDSLSWPIIFLILALTFRAALTRLFERIASVSWGDKQINFDRGLSEAQAYADRAMMAGGQRAFERPKYGETLSFVQGPLKTSIESPRQAIIEAWLEVEAELNLAAERLGVHVPLKGRQPIGLAFRLLRSTEHLNEDWTGLLNHLRRLRNQAAHDRRFDLAPDQADPSLPTSLRHRQPLELL